MKPSLDFLRTKVAWEALSAAPPMPCSTPIISGLGILAGYEVASASGTIPIKKWIQSVMERQGNPSSREASAGEVALMQFDFPRDTPKRQSGRLEEIRKNLDLPRSGNLLRICGPGVSEFPPPKAPANVSSKAAAVLPRSVALVIIVGVRHSAK